MSSETKNPIDVFFSFKCLQKKPRQPVYTQRLLLTCLKSYEMNPAPLCYYGKFLPLPNTIKIISCSYFSEIKNFNFFSCEMKA